MKIIVHDYAGHPFQVQLSRALARRGHQVLHLYSASTPNAHGSVSKLAGDPDSFNCYGVYISQPFQKYSLLKRRFQEVEYGKLVRKEVERYKPEVIISANTPLDAQKILLKQCRQHNIKFVYWVQDLFGVALKNILSNKYGPLGKIVAAYYEWLEGSLLAKSDQLIVITEDFVDILMKRNIVKDKIHVIYNWAPLEELPLCPRDNDWSEKYGLSDKMCILYSGTLSLKHNPGLILDLAVHLKGRNDVRLVIISEGIGADFLKEEKEKLQLENLILLPFQPYSLLPKIHASADILMAILEKDAGIFSVPSKMFTYHCAGRPMLLAVPPDNLCARLVKNNNTGITVSPDDHKGFVQAAENLLTDRELRQVYGANARKFAEKTFAIEKITDKFEQILKNQGGDSNMKAALVCGAGGFIGSHMVSRLKKEGFWVRGVDLKYPEYSATEADDFVVGDLRDPQTCRNVVDRRFDEIYQFAADMGGAGFVFTGDNDADIMHNSALINLNILEACQKRNNKRIFYSSSACMYPEFNQEDPDNPNCAEDSAYPAKPDSEYGWEKLFSERLYLAFHRNYGFEVRVARYHNIFGPEGTWRDGREKAPAALCRKVAETPQGGEIEIWGDGKQTRSFLYIDECLEGTIRLMRSDFAGPVNIGSDEMVTINQLANMIAKIAGKTLTMRHISGPQGVRGRNSDNHLIYKALGWKPSQPLEVGLGLTYDWIAAQVQQTRKSG